ncbi:MAG: UDP-glucose/GDP-mannose dehydrogenase family protein [Kiritimatiellae bacterium]|nr:UDP-glucose/GDP-mannose dehydrogenase family protein [Kiritimatiellia bacterium]MDW8457893.1 UDP-glucose/GDP-mannose dehydrogenase family protein [Verrucomicrobiota bacterium]
MNITVVGTGYVGLVTGACFSDWGHNVLCVDNDENKIRMLKHLQMPIYEVGLEDLVKRNVAAGRLHFTTSIAEGTHFAEVIFIAVGTPPGYRGAANLSYVEQVGRQVAEHMTDYKLLVEKSTVPVNTHEQLKRTVTKYLRADIPFDVASNPEFLKEGTAIEDAFHPDRIVIGVESARAEKLLREIYQPILDRTGCPLLVMNPASAELTKHASNSFLAMKISFINAVARICELAGADVEQVALGMGLDKRIGPQFLKAGVGYGGSCFPKDVDAFVQIADHLGYNFELLKEVQRVNKTQREHVLQKIQRELWVVQDKVIAILGLAFKPGTDDIREAPSLFFVPQLIEMGAKLRLWDPIARDRFAQLFPSEAYFKDPIECATGADLLLILTDWPQVKQIDLDQLKAVMRCPVIVDGRNVFDPRTVRAKGFTYHSVGRP